MLLLTMVLALGLARGGAAGHGASHDADLLAAIARGDREALHRLYERYAGRVLGCALRVLGVRSEGEDVTQEVFVEIWRGAGSFDHGRGSAAGWILAIARHRALDRARQRRPEALEAQAVQLADDGRSPLEDAESQEARVRVQVALGELSAEQRAVIELGFYEGLSQAEIAERTGDPLGTVKSRVRAAMQHLASVLGGAAS
jgi:RNA polymerase sigma-70 factor (ECF subfamily)